MTGVLERARRRRQTPDGLRVGLPPALADAPGGSGHNNMWRQVVGRLRRDAAVTIAEPARRAAVDVWLGDGHQGPLPVDAPQLLQVHEAGWGTPELRAVVTPAFLEHLETHIGAAAAAGAHIVTPSRSAAGQIAEMFGVPERRLHPVPHGVDATVFRPGLGGGRALVARAGGAADRPYVLFVGIAHPRKNVDVLRTAMAALNRRGFPHQLVLVSNPPPDRPNGQQLLDEISADLPGGAGPVVRVAPPSDAQLAALMAGAAVLCLPSLMEGFGLPVLEAMACGTPVVASNRGALPEVLSGAGVLVEPTAAEVEAGIASVLDDEAFAGRLAVAGRARALELSWDSTADGWRQALRVASQER